jgi:protoheme IX farnesyltransferase
MSQAGVTTGIDIARLAQPRDFVTLMKPRVMSLVVFTAFAGLLAAPGAVDPVLGAASILFIALGAGASGALNMGLEAETDRLMARTRLRPTATGRISRNDALTFGGAVSLCSVLGLWMSAGALAAALLAFTIFFYAVVYTLWLKPHTAQNIVIGGASGALPPVVAWAAAGGGVPLEAWTLFLLIFLWTPPHFWALALYRSDDYARAGIPMMPNVAGPKSTRGQIWWYALATVAAGFLPAAVGAGGMLYAIAATAFGLLFLIAAFRVWRTGAEKQARDLFAISILYLFALFGALIAEHGIGLYRPLAGL